MYACYNPSGMRWMCGLVKARHPVNTLRQGMSLSPKSGAYTNNTHRQMLSEAGDSKETDRTLLKVNKLFDMECQLHLCQSLFVDWSYRCVCLRN